MSLIGVGLYVKDSIKAVDVYCKAFELTLGYHVLNDDGTYFHSELYNENGEEMLAVVESDEKFSGTNPVQLGFTFYDKEKLVKAFEVLSDGGTVHMEICELPWSPCCCEVTDKFGIRWFLTLIMHRPDDNFTPADCK